MDNTKQKVLLIALKTADDKTDSTERSLSELEKLAETAGLEVAGTVIQQREKPDTATFIGGGKCLELKEFCKNNGVDLAVFDDELSGTQLKNTEDAMDVAVLDRTLLVLDIFAQRAKSAEGRLQVELAQLKYRLPRLSGLGASLSRLGGGIGTRGPGESKLESDKRHINRRIKAISDKLEDVAKRRELTRSRRKKDGLPTVALVGYTNSGKSTLLNRICGADVYAENKLFATLDTSVRRMKPTAEDKMPADKEILFIDTVGFIRRLPHSLIEAFKSTLEESVNADLLLNVVDASDSEAEEQLKVTEQILTELGMKNKELYIVLNKSDLLRKPENDGESAAESAFELENYTRSKGVKVFYVSAVTGEGIPELKRACFDYFENK